MLLDLVHEVDSCCSRLCTKFFIEQKDDTCPFFQSLSDAFMICEINLRKKDSPVI